MLRPEQMSKVSVTGSKPVMQTVIETVHDLNLFHINDYDGSWEEFEPGTPVSGADEKSGKLVTVRSIESILDVDPDDVGESRIVTDDAIEEELESIRTEVNELDDRRSALENELRSVEERIDSAEPFAELGIDLDLLSGYDSLQVRVGHGREDDIRAALEDADDIETFETFSADGTVAAFARPVDTDSDALEEALVGVDFAALEVPETEGSPDEYLDTLAGERDEILSELDDVESELEGLKMDAADFLLAAEEKLSIDVQKTEVPLQFATTEHAFIAEGWVPTERYPELVRALETEAGDRVEVDELERAAYKEHGHGTEHERVQPDEHGDVAVTDGGHVDESDQPPVIQDNPGAVKPFEMLVETINRPRYFELDPTVILFLTFPVFFGLMIGDVGYGISYMLIGYGLYSKFDSAAIKSLGGIALWAGGFTVLFGIFYGEIFGFHLIGEYLWHGHPPLHKGLQPGEIDYALGWLVVSLLFGIVHLSIGWIFDFYERLSHGFMDALTESGSWLLMLYGLWTWIFAGASGSAPPMLVGSDSVFNGHPFALGFTGLPEILGLVGGIAFILGFVLLLLGEPIEAIEFLNVLVNVLSYTRLAAVLLAKAGMAFVVNLLVFGAYEHDGAYHFMLTEGPSHVTEGHVLFPGLVHGGLAGVVGGLVVLVIGHILVLALGITSAGLQAVRLEYVEFFNKFYEGGGEKYEPFGYERRYTTED